MRQHRTLCVALSIGGLGLADPSPTVAQVATPPPSAQAPATRSATPSNREMGLLRALQANPVTAPYAFVTEARGQRIALKGRVGTKQVHDVAIQTAIALGVPVVDDLVIDTAAAHQAAAYLAQLGPNSGYVMGYPSAGLQGSIPYVYPEPILGKLDDPFYGFEPPSIAYPLWWGALTAARLGPPVSPMPPSGAINPPQGPNPAQNPYPPAGSGSQPSAPADPSVTPTGEIPYGTIDMTIDPRGVATLRGSVPSFAERITLGQRVAQTAGVTEVVNLLNVQPGPPPTSDQPPPPPAPANVPAPPAPGPGAPAAGPAIRPEADPMDQRVARAIESRSALSGLPVRVKVRDGVATLSGKVPTVYEAMLAYRAVQRTPGVRDVEDRLEFAVPDDNGLNPLIEKGRPQDVEPYLEAQIRRQVGDLAHIDRVQVHGNNLDLRGTLSKEGDRERFDAILRSMAILRGFRMTAEVPVESF